MELIGAHRKLQEVHDALDFTFWLSCEVFVSHLNALSGWDNPFDETIGSNPVSCKAMQVSALWYIWMLAG